jgi:2-iminobutanoate/2-iminopropanoate deaminase
MKTNRRSAFKKVVLGLSGLLGFSIAKASSNETSSAKVTGDVIQDGEVPLFSSSVTHGGLVYVAGKGAHFEGDITAHTKHVLDELQKELEKAGSSMDKVLKVNVYLHDLNDYKLMNEAYRGRFGKNPPVRTTVAVFGGVPGNSLVEIDCIAAL